MCKSASGSVNSVDSTDQDVSPDEQVSNVNTFRLSEAISNNSKADDFKVQVLVNNHLDKVLADTGAGFSVCGVDMN